MSHKGQCLILLERKKKLTLGKNHYQRKWFNGRQVNIKFQNRKRRLVIPYLFFSFLKSVQRLLLEMVYLHIVIQKYTFNPRLRFSIVSYNFSKKKQGALNQENEPVIPPIHCSNLKIMLMGYFFRSSIKNIYYCVKFSSKLLVGILVSQYSSRFIDFLREHEDVNLTSNVNC